MKKLWKSWENTVNFPIKKIPQIFMGFQIIVSVLVI